MVLTHGGNLQAARAQFGGNDWIDLSTGISPFIYPFVPVESIDDWHRLPEESAALTTAAAAYYGTSAVLAVAGSQAALRALPRLRARSTVGIVSPTYNEHAAAWQRAGHVVKTIAVAEVANCLVDLDVLVIVNPNNPTATLLDPKLLARWHQQLASRNGWLVVDEAFADIAPQMSMITPQPMDGLIVLRSVGKFFGLAGLRLGFVVATETLRQALACELGGWTIHQAAQRIGTQALTDRAWQQQQQQRLQQNGRRLRDLVAQFGHLGSGCGLFYSWQHNAAEAFWQHCAHQHILVRAFSAPWSGIRLGLPASEQAWIRLTQALATWRRT